MTTNAQKVATLFAKDYRNWTSTTFPVGMTGGKYSYLTYGKPLTRKQCSWLLGVARQNFYNNKYETISSINEESVSISVKFLKNGAGYIQCYSVDEYIQAKRNAEIEEEQSKIKLQQLLDKLGL